MCQYLYKYREQKKRSKLHKNLPVTFAIQNGRDSGSAAAACQSHQNGHPSIHVIYIHVSMYMCIIFMNVYIRAYVYLQYMHAYIFIYIKKNTALYG